ncbi:MAG: hypothetical protein HZB32_08215, partial [Nitrospirae bacterium]|nr:hypothetical protein [Nitrospirota bacterium]
MKQGLILMFVFSLLGHIAAAGMLMYIPYQDYAVGDKPPRYGMDDQRGDAVKVLWGFVEEAAGRVEASGKDESVPGKLKPLAASQKPQTPQKSRKLKTRDETLQPKLKSSAEEGSPVAHHDWRADDGQESVALAERVSHHDPEAHNAGLYGRHSGPEAEGPIAADGSAQQSDGDYASSAPSNLSAEIGEDCSRSLSCMGGDGVTSATYASIANNGNGGKGGQGDGLKTFLEALRVEIERHKNYPPFARKNGIEGTAYLHFHIGDDGKPGGI